LSLNEIRRRSRHRADSLDETAPDHDDQPLRQIEDFKTFSPPDALLQSELEQKIESALAQLPENNAPPSSCAGATNFLTKTSPTCSGVRSRRRNR